MITELLLRLCPGARFEADGPEQFSQAEDRSKITNLAITKLFLSHILSINRVYILLGARKPSGAFEEQAPGKLALCIKHRSYTCFQGGEGSVAEWFRAMVL